MPSVTSAGTCALYGVTPSYTSGWIGVNLLIILIALLIVGVVYALGGLFGENIRQRIRGIARYELIQAMIGVLIIAILLVFASVACNLSANISTTLSGGTATMNPFQWADYYIGTVSLNYGLTLLTNLYSQSVTYSVIGQVLTYQFTNLLSQFINIGFGIFPKIAGVFSSGAFRLTGFTLGLSPKSADLGLIFTVLSSVYLTVYSPIILIAVGLLIIQFLILPLIQYTAFVVILPVAIGMRSLAFASKTLMNSSNALIAIAIAMYLIYPMMIAFDSYLMAYTFSASNPLYTYVSNVPNLASITPNTFFQANNPALTTGQGPFTTAVTTIFPFIFHAAASQLPSYNEIFQGGWLTTSTLQNNVLAMARFVFQSILLFALNLAVTIGFAYSLMRALDTTLGEAAGFW